MDMDFFASFIAGATRRHGPAARRARWTRGPGQPPPGARAAGASRRSSSPRSAGSPPRFPPSPARERSLESLARQGATVVVTGQQVGLFLGPLYTLHKAATASLARPPGRAAHRAALRPRLLAPDRGPRLGRDRQRRGARPGRPQGPGAAARSRQTRRASPSRIAPCPARWTGSSPAWPSSSSPCHTRPRWQSLVGRHYRSGVTPGARLRRRARRALRAGRARRPRPAHAGDVPARGPGPAARRPRARRDRGAPRRARGRARGPGLRRAGAHAPGGLARLLPPPRTGRPSLPAGAGRGGILHAGGAGDARRAPRPPRGGPALVQHLRPAAPARAGHAPPDGRLRGRAGRVHLLRAAPHGLRAVRARPAHDRAARAAAHRRSQGTA